LTGRYEVRIAYTANPNRRNNATIGVYSASGRDYRQLDQKKKPSAPPFHSLGVFEFIGQAVVEIRNDRRTPTDEGHVVVDAVQFLKR
jgi:hypothetical protein